MDIKATNYVGECMITIMFGAGASYDSGRTIPYNPPLGKDLFERLVSLKGAFYNLSDETKKVFIDDGFEAGMAKIPNDSRQINPLQREIAIYLSKFQPTPNNAYTRLFKKLRLAMKKISIVTLNYDILIEQSLSLNGFQSDYKGSGDYGVTLLKPHGSSNFLPSYPHNNIFKNIVAIDCNVFMEGLEIDIAINSHDVIKWCGSLDNEDLSPVLCMYEKGKRAVINPSIIIESQQKYNELALSSDLIILVGIKYIEHDHHIWGVLEQNNSPLLIVDPFPQDTIDWANRVGKKDVQVIQSGFNDAVWKIVKVIKKHLYS
ncbi:hypothetical protein [Aeromonas caviae]